MTVIAYQLIATEDNRDRVRRVVADFTDDELRLTINHAIALIWVCKDEQWKRREGGA